MSGDVGDLDKRVAIDDLTFDNPIRPSVAARIFPLLPFTSVIEVGPGGRSPIWITINRFGGSSGDIQFAASGLPPGVTATFTPNPVGGAGTLLTRDGERPTPRRPTPGR